MLSEILKETIVENCFDCMIFYQSECNQVFENWKLVYSNGVLWIENNSLKLRIRAADTKDTLKEYFRARGDASESEDLEKSITGKEIDPPLQPRIHMQKYQEPSYLNDRFDARRAGLLGCDRAGGW